MQPYVIGIDIGTGSTKALAIDGKGQVLSSAQHHYSTQHPQPGYAEQNPDEIWKAFVQCVQEVVAERGEAPAVISLSSCMHSLMALDEMGAPLTPLLNWADARSESVVDDLRAGPDAAQLYVATGTPIHSMTPLSKIIWFGKHDKAVYNKATKWISIKEYIWYQLFGVFEVDVSVAASNGLLNLSTLQWHGPALNLCGIGEEKLSQVVAIDFLRKTVQPAVAQKLGIAAGVPFCMGSTDGCLSNVGSRALAPGVAALTIGTSGAVRVAASKPVLPYPAMPFNYPLDAQTFICGGPVNNGGNTVHWALKKMLQQTHPTEKDYERFYEDIEQVPAGSNGLLCLPYLIGERAPVWDAKSSGVFVGVNSQHTQAHFFRAALEGVCFALNEVIQMVEGATGNIKTIHVSGGFIRAEVWLQMLADITGKSLCITSNRDASATGAALVGMKAIGMIQHYEEIPMQEEGCVQPDKEKQEWYSRHFKLYQAIYPALKDTMHGLHALQQNGSGQNS